MKYKSSIAIFCLTAISFFCVWKGINSEVLYTCVLAIAGLGGYAIHKDTTLR